VAALEREEPFPGLLSISLTGVVANMLPWLCLLTRQAASRLRTIKLTGYDLSDCFERPYPNLCLSFPSLKV
jgi:hypothetical protein